MRENGARRFWSREFSLLCLPPSDDPLAAGHRGHSCLSADDLRVGGPPETSAPEPSQSLAKHLRDSIASVQLQIRLLRSVLWWYLAPIALSLFLISFDSRMFRRLHFDGRFFLMNAVTLAVFYWIWQLNQRAVRKDLEPRLRELEGTLAELEA